VGRQDLIDACAFNACPRAFIGRPMKVGKEEIAGLMAAIRWYLDLDHARLMQEYERQVQAIIDAFAGHPCVSARRSVPSEAGQPNPRAELVFDEAGMGLTRDEILKMLYEGNPAISLAAAGRTAFTSIRKRCRLGKKRSSSPGSTQSWIVQPNPTLDLRSHS
jgi:L-seryl-tRNA(Ser) seleniumtransferase